MTGLLLFNWSLEGHHVDIEVGGLTRLKTIDVVHFSGLMSGDGIKAAKAVVD